MAQPPKTDVAPVVAPVVAPDIAPDIAPDVAPVVAPPPGHPRFPLMDSMRAIAALSVVLTHTGFDSSAFQNPHYGRYVLRLEAGVAIFFLISAFLLYRPFISARLNRAPRPALRDYTRRRLIRIVPAYWLALTVLAALGLVSAVFGRDWWAYYGFAQVYSNDWVLNGIGPAWTLCVEITFYALLPLYALAVGAALGRLTRRTQAIAELIALGAIFAASLWLRWWLRKHVAFSPLLNTLPTHMDWFALGMAFAIVSATWPRRIARAPVLWWLAALGIFYLAAHYVSGPQAVHVGTQIAESYAPGDDVRRHLLYGLMAAFALAPAAFDGGGVVKRGAVRRLLADRRLAWLGLISYGIYLWHNPLATWICQHNDKRGCLFHGSSTLRAHPELYLTLLTAAAAIAAAALSYYALERPILRLKNRA